MRLAMLVQSFSFHVDNTAEMFGFWYYRDHQLPTRRENRQSYFADLMDDRCCQVKLRGTIDQLFPVLSYAGECAHWLSGLRASIPSVSINEILSAANVQRGTTVILEAMPNATVESLPLEVDIAVVQSADVIKAFLQTHVDIVEL